jgi:hypothetical protein
VLRSHPSARARRWKPQVGHAQHVGVRERRRLAQAVLQLPDIARPVVALERGQRRLRQRQAGPPGLDGRLVQDALGQQPDVLAARAERGQLEHQTLEAEVEVLAEPSLGDAPLEVAVRRRDHTHVDPGRPRGADTIEALFLEHPEELGLVIGAQVADLVQEDRAAVGLLEPSLAVGHGAREAAADVPEQLALEEVGRDGGHVHGDEGMRGGGPGAGGRARGHHHGPPGRTAPCPSRARR